MSQCLACNGQGSRWSSVESCLDAYAAQHSLEISGLACLFVCLGLSHFCLIISSSSLVRIMQRRLPLLLFGELNLTAS